MNCCSITSNLNNPSLQIQETIQIRSAMRSTQPNEVFYFNELPDEAKRLRLAADERRQNLNLPITASYTFSDGEINLLDNSIINYNNMNQQQQQHFSANNNNHQPPTQSINIPTPPTNSSTPTNRHHQHDFNNRNNNHTSTTVQLTQHPNQLANHQRTHLPRKRNVNDYNSFSTTTNNSLSTPKQIYSLRHPKLDTGSVVS